MVSARGGHFLTRRTWHRSVCGMLRIGQTRSSMARHSCSNAARCAGGAATSGRRWRHRRSLWRIWARVNNNAAARHDDRRAHSNQNSSSALAWRGAKTNRARVNNLGGSWQVIALPFARRLTRPTWRSSVFKPFNRYCRCALVCYAASLGMTRV